MNIVPHILDDTRLMLQYAVDLSALIDIKTIQSSNSQIQAPEVQMRNMLQRVVLRSGETLVVTGFDDALLNIGRGGMGSADTPILGGYVNGKKPEQPSSSLFSQ